MRDAIQLVGRNRFIAPSTFVARVPDRPFSSFHRDVGAGLFPRIGPVTSGRSGNSAVKNQHPPMAGACRAQSARSPPSSAHREDRCIARRHFADSPEPPLPYPRIRGSAIDQIEIRKIVTQDGVARSVRRARGERGIWQGRFWEHLIRDDEDYRRHVDN